MIWFFWLVVARALAGAVAISVAYGLLAGRIAFALGGVAGLAVLYWLDRRLARREGVQLNEPVMMQVVGSGRGWEPYRKR